MAKLRISLANKCQLMFGAAVILILTAALSVPWLRMQKLVDEGQKEIARRLAQAWLDDLIQLGGELKSPAQPLVLQSGQVRPLSLTLIEADRLEAAAAADPFIAQAMVSLEDRPDQEAIFARERNERGRGYYRYARAVRQSDLEPSRGGYEAGLAPTQVADPLRAILLIELQADWASNQLLLNRVYITIAGLLAGVLAIAVFWLITTQIILSPVRVLRNIAEKVSDGDLNIRADINTGDEFEQLSDTFNTMLANLKDTQDQLRSLNKQLDLKLGELAASNVSLFEANRLKGEFLANVSHELRTPLNSIIGFAEVLSEGFEQEKDPRNEKRRRYLEHIQTSSRSLLQLITELLDLAKIEAGRIELHMESMSVSDMCEGLLTLIRPQADRKSIELELSVSKSVPIIRTDPGKFQQIIFNFLSNAVKFTPERGQVELGADVEPAEDEVVKEVRIWVRDTGPGIPAESHEVIFEKFRQLDSTHTKSHEGAGLGLAISRELARLLGGRIELESEVGGGAQFSLVIPVNLESKEEPLMPERVG